MRATEVLYLGSRTATAAAMPSTAGEVEFVVSVAASPAAALDRVGRADVDCVVCEFPLPDGDVEAFLSSTRATSDAAVVVAAAGGAPVETIPSSLYDEVHVADDGAPTPADLARVVARAVRGARDADGAPRVADTSCTGGTDDSGDSGDVAVPSELEAAFSESSGERTFPDVVLNSLADIVYLADLDGDLLRWNRRLNEVTGYSDEELSEMSVVDLVADLDRERVGQAFQQIVERGEYAREIELRTVAGETIPYHTVASVVDDGDGAASYVCGVARDITDRRETERRLDAAIEELERSNAELEQFAYVASHDLREPLRMISSYLQLLERRYGGELDDDADEFIGYAVDGADRMREMINGLLAYSRVGRYDEQFEELDANAVVETALSNLEVAVEESDAVVEVDDLPTVVGDHRQPTQLFQNLVSNAIKYAGDGPPRVAIDCVHRDDVHEFRVADDGVGIDPDVTDDLFAIFSTAGDDGTGIGLAVCEKIVERHGGEIWVDSTPGEGSTFHFTVPVEATDDDQVAAAPEAVH